MKKTYVVYNGGGGGSLKKFDDLSEAREFAANLLRCGKADKLTVYESIEVIQPKEVPIEITAIP